MPAMPGGVEVALPWPPKEQLLEDNGSYKRISPWQVVLPMRQGIGAPCQPVVKPGDRVKIGQLVGTSKETISSLVHASVSGVVSAVEDRPEAGGGLGLAVVIDNDREERYVDGLELRANLGDLQPKDIVEAVRQAGIVGMGGARFPTHVKLQPEDTITHVLANGCECEPMQAADDALMQTDTENILYGIAAAMRAVGAPKALVGIESNKPGAIAAMQVATETIPDIEVRVIETRYPEGGEKQLVKALVGREVPQGSLPAKAGVVVLNVATCAAIGNALMTGAPLTHRICTVSGDVVTPRNLLFPIGTPVAAMLDACGGFKGRPSKVIMGGPMMGTTLDDLTVPMLKGGNGLIAVCEDNDAFYNETPCIRCNKCVEACPMRLEPLFIDRAWRADKLDRCRQLQADSCINCGCCTYVCPARRRLAEKIVEAKNMLAQQQKEARH